jgi:hypothetical protein
MTEICIFTGTVFAAWDEVTRLLVGTNSDNFLCNAVTDLHDKHAISGKPLTEANAVSTLKNTKSSGWADQYTANYLDIWANAAPASKMVFVYCSPRAAFARAIIEYGSDLEQINAVMVEWEVGSRKLFSFFQSNHDRVLLINDSAYFEQMAELQKCYAAFTGENIYAAEPEACHDDVTIMALASSVLTNYDDLYSLYEYMQSAASLPGLDIQQTTTYSAKTYAIACEGLNNYIKLKQFEKEFAQQRLENELCLLQIHQLQEELEHYYLACNSAVRLTDDHITSSRASAISFAAGCHLVGAYSEDGYQDLQLVLGGLVLADGRQYEKLTCKIVDISGTLGLEIRQNDNDEDLVRWPDEMHDDHGRFMLYLPEYRDGYGYDQAGLRAALSTDDRLLMSAIIQGITDAFVVGRVGNAEIFPQVSVKIWRMLTVNLARQHQTEEQYLTFNQVETIESYAAEGYEHIWFEVKALQSGQRVINSFDFKFVKTESAITEKFHLEIREQLSNEVPLESWPPEKTDEFGSKLIVPLVFEQGEVYFNTEEDLTYSDQQLIKSLISKIPSIFKAGNLQEKIAEDMLGWYEVINSLIDSDVIFGVKQTTFNKIKHRIKSFYA